MVIRHFGWILIGGALGSGIAAHAAAQAGYPAQPQPQPYAQPAPAQPQPAPYAQPAQAQPQYQQPAPAPAPAPAPGYPQPAPAPFGAQPAPAPAPGYPAAPGQYQFPAPAPDIAPPPSGGMPDGAFQLGLYTTFVRYEPLHLEAENNGGERDVSTLNWGIADNPLQLELGYGLSDMIVFGGTLGLGGDSQTTETPGAADAESSNFIFEFGPKLDFMFSPGAKVNPFAGALIVVHLESSDPGDTSTTAFLFLARVGLRAFLTDTFSIDPALVAGGGFGSGSTDAGAGDVDFDVSGFRIGLNLGVSGWLL